MSCAAQRGAAGRYTTSEASTPTMIQRIGSHSYATCTIERYAIMKKAGTSTLLALVALLAMAWTLLLVPSSAYAGSCYGTGCNGQDPAATFCNDSSTGTPDSYEVPGYKVEIRFSLNCRAAWSRGTSTTTGYPTNVWMTSSLNAVRGENGTPPSAISGTIYSNSNPGIKQIYGNMAAGTAVRACASFSNGKIYCTGALDTLHPR